MQRILVVMPNWFGETLFATPLLRALREQRRDALITTLGRPRCGEVLTHNPHVDTLMDYDEQGRHRHLLGQWRLVRELRAQQFDTAFVLRKSLSRTLLLALAGIPVRVGFANPKSGWLLTHRMRPSTASMHKASTYLPLLEAVGLAVVPGPYEYTVGEEERRWAREWLGAQRARNGRPLIALHPGANWWHKRWSPERFAALADRLSEIHRIQVAITGGPDDVGLARDMTQRMRHPAMVLAGQTTLRQLAALLEQIHLVIANDTGVLHIAAALGRPVVALYGPTSPQLTGPLGDPQRTTVLHHAGCCPRIPCFRAAHPPHPGMDAITVDEVYTAATQLLNTCS